MTQLATPRATARQADDTAALTEIASFGRSFAGGQPERSALWRKVRPAPAGAEAAPVTIGRHP